MRVPASTALRMPSDTSTKSRKVLKWCLACLDKFVNLFDSPCLPLATWLNSPRSAGVAMWSAVGRASAWIVRYGGTGRMDRAATARGRSCCLAPRRRRQLFLFVPFVPSSVVRRMSPRQSVGLQLVASGGNEGLKSDFQPNPLLKECLSLGPAQTP